LWEIGSQALVTALCGLVAAPVWLALGGASAMGNFDFVILVALLGLIVGASLAWYLPQTAANRRSRLNHAMQIATAGSLPEKPTQPTAVLETSVSEQPTYLAA
jgi:membrane associated rhomboid family serine protease